MNRIKTFNSFNEGSTMNISTSEWVYGSLYKWARMFGADELLSKKNINNGLMFKRALDSGKVTAEELDSVSTDQKFSELPMYQEILKD